MIRIQIPAFLAWLILFSSGSNQTAVPIPQEKIAEAKKFLRLQGVGRYDKAVTVRIEHNGKVFYGRPLGQDAREVALLRWDGRMSRLPRRNKMEFWDRKNFTPYTHQELEKRLQKQYGDRYLTQSSEHFVVVYPRTKEIEWATRYESVYQQFKNYLASQKIEIVQPTFPMIVVVLGSRNEFVRELSDEIIFKKDVYGFYSRITNRVTTFVSSDPRIARQVNRVAALTVVHEAIHQAAFNSNVHSRLCVVPRWTSEGFATLFESNGFRRNDPEAPVSDRVNGRRLRTLQKMIRSGKAEGAIEKMLRNDRMFETEPDLAYSLAWGLSFYLAELDSDKYLRFVIEDSNQNEFALYKPSERVAFFIDTFKIDFNDLERRLHKFILAL